MWREVEPDGSVILRKFQGLASPTAQQRAGSDPIICTVVDTETTGTEVGSDRVIEIALQPVLLDPETFECLEYLDPYNALQDPGRPIPAEASAVNGIFDADVKDKSIDWSYVHELLSLSDFVVAHNANFDAPMIDNELVRAKKRIPLVPWACSLQMLSWESPARNLEVLCWQHGFWYEAHRAITDVHALTQLLLLSGRIKELYEKSQRPSYLLRANKSPYQSKDWLKNQKFRWEGQVWSRTFESIEDAQKMREALSAHVYGVHGRNESTIEVVSPRQRYHLMVLGDK